MKPRSPDLAIFVLTDGRTKPIALPLARVHGVIILVLVLHATPPEMKRKEGSGDHVYNQRVVLVPKEFGHCTKSK